MKRIISMLLIVLSIFSVTSMVSTKSAKAYEEVPIYVTLYDGTDLLVAYGDIHGETIRPGEELYALSSYMSGTWGNALTGLRYLVSAYGNTRIFIGDLVAYVTHNGEILTPYNHNSEK